jgi:membrane-bound lytic murein transglycosylase D
MSAYSFFPKIVFAVLIAALGTSFPLWAAGPVKESQDKCSRYSLPASVLRKPFYFAGELIPIQRADVQTRILAQINFLLLDARSVLTEWLIEKGRYSWLFQEILAKESIPPEFALLAPILSRSSLKSAYRSSGAGWWALDKPCSNSDGLDMTEDSWHDDRMDLELSTRCFAVRMKKTRADLGSAGWITAAAAYVTSVKTIDDARQRWKTDQYWDMPLPDLAEDLIVRWIALGIINSHRDFFGLRFKDAVPFTFDQVNNVVLVKDLPVAEMARLTTVSPRVIMELNPKIRASSPVFPATVNGKSAVHSISAPKGKGELLVHGLLKEGYVSGAKKP